jgi:hypothetical protein
VIRKLTATAVIRNITALLGENITSIGSKHCYLQLRCDG